MRDLQVGRWPSQQQLRISFMFLVSRIHSSLSPPIGRQISLYMVSSKAARNAILVVVVHDCCLFY